MKNKYLYGFMGLLSLIGFIGVFSEERIFLVFFAFAVHFEYFFIKSDEMLNEYMNKSAAIAFYLGMLTVALFTVISFAFSNFTGSEALVYGFSFGWITSTIIYGISVAYFSIKESRALKND